MQRRAGQREIAERVGRTIHTVVPDAAAHFLAGQPMVVLAAADDSGRPWVTRLTGPPGFLRVPDSRTIEIAAVPEVGDPLAAATPRQLGLLAIEPGRRRRMRANGAVRRVGGRLRITVDQVYSNCPKYIARRYVVGPEITVSPDMRVRSGAALSPRQQRAVAAADAFFVGSVDAEGRADASHRGGNPGFLQVRSPSRLYWPEYRGNSMFMTLGNIAVEPRCGLLVPDWETGGMLQLTGRAAAVWHGGDGSGSADSARPGGVEFSVDAVVEHPAGPLRWTSPELSPANP